MTAATGSCPNCGSAKPYGICSNPMCQNHNRSAANRPMRLGAPCTMNADCRAVLHGHGCPHDRPHPARVRDGVPCDVKNCPSHALGLIEVRGVLWAVCGDHIEVAK